MNTNIKIPKLITQHEESLLQFIGHFPALIISCSLLGERKYSHAIPPVSMVLAEVCWMSVMTVLTFVSSVLSTRYGPAKMCSSSPISWMNFFIFFAYLVTLLVVTILHAPLVPSIWYSNISEIPWFDFSAPPAPRITPGSFPSDKSDPEGQAIYGDASRSVRSVPEIECNGDDQQQTLKAPPRPPWFTLPRGSLTVSVASFTPAWAKQYNLGLTRGLHNPFNRSLDKGSVDHHILDVPSDPVQPPSRVITKPAFEDRPHERDDDLFAAPSRHGTVVTKVSNDYNDKKRSLQALSGFSNLPRWSTATTPSEIDSQSQGTGKRGIGMLMLQNPSDRASNTTATTTTAVPLSPPGRKSVSSLFPHDVREEDWNFPLTKPPFRNGRGEGWTTADATQDTVPAGRGRGRR
ncbi:hypothetical protein BDM02DRAFT_3126005 [Thelephora ganbajun]|uniref:Uncharacterized protein n=1 Tax=Thelephora ganbajun TaxID=370292 RepID=A0ACB6ZUP7_THEGA|nr:hypothetical protein BDM02DRAFT_3126005 [Thelephora ganbajun]